MNNQRRLFIVGAAKAGTTGLFETLRSHNDVFLPVIKEPNYFAIPDMTPKYFQRIYKHDIELNLPRVLKGGSPWHIAHIEREEDYQKLYANAQKDQWLVDASTSYLWSKGAAHRINAMFPMARVVILLRQPLDRMMSHFSMNVREGKNQHSNILEEVTFDFNKQQKGWGVSHQYVELSLYFEQVMRYVNVFNQEQVLIRPYEYWKNDAGSFLRELSGFLQVTPFSKEVQLANLSQQPRWPTLNRILQEKGITHRVKKAVPERFKQSIKAMYMSPSKSVKVSDSDQSALSSLVQDDWRKTTQFLANYDVFWKNYLK